MIYPILLEPVAKEYLWGGTHLMTHFGKECGLSILAESWELAVHPEGESSVANGRHAGRRLSDLLREYPEILGAGRSEMPLLVKYIDTRQNLSVQVHPDDAYAQAHHGGPGKTEFWYIVDCAPDAELYYGLREELSKEEFKRRAHDGSIEEVLNKVKVKPGDSFLIPPGVVHAIGANMTVAEVGTNCNITYRIYDYNRKDAQGNPRPLHVDAAADVFVAQDKPGVWQDNRIDCGPFEVSVLHVQGMLDMQADKDSFQCLMCIQGHCFLDRALELHAGASVLIPAGYRYTLRGDATVLMVTV